MANINIRIELNEYRPCIVNEKKALFHRWVYTKNLLKEEFEVGIVEYENGQIEKITPNKIRFTDNKIQEYDFNNKESE
ncbi:MAG: hypothetical protein HFJ59_03975 [Clostridia bacterium]|nr:hypothetical protein [Clostridia bacterium]